MLTKFISFLGGAGAGAVAGAYIGSIVPGAGTLIGGGIGFAAGLVGGAYTGYEWSDDVDKLFSSQPDRIHQLVNAHYSQEEFNNLGCKDFESLA